MKDNKIKERAYQSFKIKHTVALFVLPIVIVFAIAIMIIMVCNGIKDTKIYLGFVAAIIIGLIAFFSSLYVVKKSKEEDNK